MQSHTVDCKRSKPFLLPGAEGVVLVVLATNTWIRIRGRDDTDLVCKNKE